MRLSILLAILLLLSCKEQSTSGDLSISDVESIQLKYAKGFSVKKYDGYSILELLKPWPKADKTYKYVLLDSTSKAPRLENETFDAIIDYNLDRVVVTSTTHIPALELLGVHETLVGFPSTAYISSKKTRARIDAKQVRELGKNETINTEVLLSLQPDVVIGFGIDGINTSFKTIKKTGIPVIYNGDWVEASALAKAEWIKFFGALFHKEQLADSIFNQIEADYIKAKTIAKQAKNIPTVFSGAMYKDVWYLPNGESAEAQFFKDANTNYLWKDTTGNGSLSLSFEAVLTKAQHADLWISPSFYTSLDQLKDANTLYTNFKAFQSKSVYSFSATTGETGGILYYELGIARPDIVLKDIIKICHPELLGTYTPFFFKPIN